MLVSMATVGFLKSPKHRHKPPTQTHTGCTRIYSYGRVVCLTGRCSALWVKEENLLLSVCSREAFNDAVQKFTTSSRYYLHYLQCNMGKKSTNILSRLISPFGICAVVMTATMTVFLPCHLTIRDFITAYCRSVLLSLQYKVI